MIDLKLIDINNTKLPESAKLASHIASFFTQEEHGELAFYTDSQKRKLMEAQKVLMTLAIKHKQK